MADPGDPGGAGAAPSAPPISPARARRHRRRRIQRIGATALTAVVIVGLGLGIAWGSTRPTQSVYRTAVATLGSVTQSVTAAGSLADVDQANASFATAGTVSAIDVAVGDTVTAGQVLGTLDKTDLASAVSDARTNLSDAEQTLQHDQDAQQSAAASSSSAASATTSSPATADSGSGSGSNFGSGSGSGGGSGFGGQGTVATGSGGTGTRSGGYRSGTGGPASQGAGQQHSGPATTASGAAGGRSQGGRSETAGNPNQAQIQRAQSAIIGCRQLLDYLVGHAMVAGSCATAPTTEASGTGSGRPAAAGRQEPGMAAAGNQTAPLAERQSAGSRGGRGGGTVGTSGGARAPGTSVAGPAVPVSQGCSVILSATGDGGTTVTVTSGTTTTLTSTVTPTSQGGGVTDSDVTSTTTGPDTVTQTVTVPPTTVYLTVPTTVTQTGTTTSPDTPTDPPGEPLRGSAGAFLPGRDWSSTPTAAPSSTAASSSGAASTPATASPSRGRSKPTLTGFGTSAPTAGSLADAVTACQSAISTAVGALNNLDAWETVLDNLLQISGSSTTTSTGAAQGGRGGTHPAGTVSRSGAAGPGTQVTGTAAPRTAPEALGGNESGLSGPGTRTNASGLSGNVSGLSGSGTRTNASGLSGNVSGSSGVAGRVPTAADVAADQAQIDLMATNLAMARQNAADATLTSPITGTVAAVTLAKGDSVAASSTSQTITIVGRKQYQIVVSIPLTEIELIKTGQRVSVTVNGVSTALSGSVSLIGVLDNSSTSTPSYPVTVVLDRTTEPLFDGAGAALTIDAGSVDHVLTVPSSAVSTTGSRHTVTVFSDGKTSVVAVQIGLVGPERTQITAGLTAGQVVVLADVDQPLPTISTTARLGGFGGGGGGLVAGAGGGPARFGR